MVVAKKMLPSRFLFTPFSAKPEKNWTFTIHSTAALRSHSSFLQLSFFFNFSEFPTPRKVMDSG